MSFSLFTSNFGNKCLISCLSLRLYTLARATLQLKEELDKFSLKRNNITLVSALHDQSTTAVPAEDPNLLLPEEKELSKGKRKKGIRYEDSIQFSNPLKWRSLQRKRYRNDQRILRKKLNSIGISTASKDAPLNISGSYPDIIGEVVFGIHPVRLALKQGRRTCHRLLVKTPLETSPLHSNEKTEKRNEEIKEILKLARMKGVPISLLTSHELNLLSPNRPNQGICLDASPLDYVETDVDNLFQDLQKAAGFSDVLWLFLDHILDPMNFGALVRSSYFLGVDRVFAARPNTAKLSPIVSKASSGILEVYPVYAVIAEARFFEECRSYGFKVFKTVGKEEKDQKQLISAFDFELSGPTVIIFGNEGVGVRKELDHVCDGSIYIPPSRKLVEECQSLNVSVAAGILLFAASRRKLIQQE